MLLVNALHGALGAAPLASRRAYMVGHISYMAVSGRLQLGAEHVLQLFSDKFLHGRNPRVFMLAHLLTLKGASEPLSTGSTRCRERRKASTGILRNGSAML